MSHPFSKLMKGVLSLDSGLTIDKLIEI